MLEVGGFWDFLGYCVEVNTHVTIDMKLLYLLQIFFKSEDECEVLRYQLAWCIHRFYGHIASYCNQF